MNTGFAIPQVFPDGTIDLDEIRNIALKAEALGFDDLWTQEQVVGSSNSLEPLSLLSYLAAITDRIGCGCLSLEKCSFFNPGDGLAASGPGPHRLSAE